MILQYEYLRKNKTVFQAMAGLRLAEFDELVEEMMPKVDEAETKRLTRPNRQREIGGGPNFELSPRNQLLLTVI